MPAGDARWVTVTHRGDADEGCSHKRFGILTHQRGDADEGCSHKRDFKSCRCANDFISDFKKRKKIVLATTKLPR
jgi:hypothetical protein